MSRTECLACLSSISVTYGQDKCVDCDTRLGCHHQSLKYRAKLLKSFVIQGAIQLEIYQVCFLHNECLNNVLFITISEEIPYESTVCHYDMCRQQYPAALVIEYGVPTRY